MKHKHSIPLATLLAAAQARESAAAQADREQHFEMQLATAFPSLWGHAAISGADCVTAHVKQWSFELDSADFLVRWQRTPHGGYWTFDAWFAEGGHVGGDSGGYHAPDADTALCCFVWRVLTVAGVMMMGEVA